MPAYAYSTTRVGFPALVVLKTAAFPSTAPPLSVTLLLRFCDVLITVASVEAAQKGWSLFPTRLAPISFGNSTGRTKMLPAGLDGATGCHIAR